MKLAMAMRDTLLNAGEKRLGGVCMDGWMGNSLAVWKKLGTSSKPTLDDRWLNPEDFPARPRERSMVRCKGGKQDCPSIVIRRKGDVVDWVEICR
jgi:hypothetical protein